MNFVLIANPQSPRVEKFQQALASFNLPPAQLIPYEDLLNDRDSLTHYDSPTTYFRFDAPERNFATDRGFIAAGANVLAPDNPPDFQSITAAQALSLVEDKGRIYHPRQWYLGWRSQLQNWAQPLQGQILNHPNDIAQMFDKIQCQRILAENGIPIARSLTQTRSIHNYDQLKAVMAEVGCDRVFVKLAHGSAASGVVAYEYWGDAERAITTVERAIEEGELRFYNSRKVRQYRNPEHVADIINFLAKESIQVEAWMPKARIEGREFDARVVVIGGKARQVVLRLGKSPMTNLHLGSDRRTLADLPSGLTPAAWTKMLDSCEQAVACFPQTFYCGVDLLIAPNLKDHYIIELNAFGDLVKGVTWQGQETHTTELDLLLKRGTEPCSM